MATWLEKWDPENEQLWNSGGSARAWKTLWITTGALTFSFSTWFIMSALVVKLPGIGFKFDQDQLFWLAAMPGLAGGLLRIIQSIPSPKAEPFKLWLAQVGSERIEEIENPELAIQRTRETYKLKGYSDEWIEKRMRSIAIREELTEEWSERGIKEQKEYAILTAQISKATFGLTPSEYKEVKNLKRENLRDHMTDLELIFSMLGEASTAAIVKAQKPIGFTENKKVAKQGGYVAGNARKELEIKTGEKVVSPTNYKVIEEKKQKRIK